jgi:hypothetical protein
MKRFTHVNHVVKLLRVVGCICFETFVFGKKINLTAGLAAEKLAKLSMMARQPIGPDATPTAL